MRTPIRCVLLVLAFVHTFPAIKHLAAFFTLPSTAEAWKGFGALVAISLYLLPSTLQARALIALWRRSRALVTLVSVTLIAVHLVPALDHVPRFLSHPTWPDGWRGLGAVLAMVWFALSVPLQAKLLSRVGAFARAIHLRERKAVLGSARQGPSSALDAARRQIPSWISEP